MSRKIETLAGLPLFASLPAAALRRLEARCLWRRASQKEWIIDYQDESIDVFFVVAGLARVVIYAKSGREVILADVPAGGMFGELAAIDGKPRSAGVLALTDTTIACMPGEVFNEALQTHPSVTLEVLRLLAARVRALDTRVFEYATLNVQQRICSELLRLSRPDPKNPLQGRLSPPPIHAEIAARVSTHREAVAREMKSLERKGLLERRRGAFVLTDIPALMMQMDPKE